MSPTRWKRLGRITVGIDYERPSRPVWVQRTVPGIERGWVYDVWAWPLWVEIDTTDTYSYAATRPPTPPRS